MRRSIFISILTVLSFSVYAQKVALVFSGGGAKGLAHIGVLKALEENEIPIDYVVGTSMGGIVAGCYAAGYSPDEIEHIVLSDDFMNWIEGNPEEGFNYSFYKKKDNAEMVSISLALDSSLNAQFNSTLANDLSLNFALAEKLAQASVNANNNFDSLMIPLRIVASEVFTQSTEVIATGSLNNALRVTLSVPFFYKPIKIDGRYLFDGGIYNNFPVDVAQKEFSPDFIIGVNVSSKVFSEYPYKNDDQLISNSLLYMLLDKSDIKKYNENILYIEPDITPFSSFDFNKAKGLIDSGYQATLKLIPELKAQISRNASCDDLAEKRNDFKDDNLPLMFSSVKVFDFNDRQELFIKRLFNTDGDHKVPLSTIKKSYFRLMSEPFFQNIYPNITYDSISRGFVLELHGRPQNDLKIQLGGNLSSRNISAIYLGSNFYYFNSFLINTYFNVYSGNFSKSGQIKSRIYLPGFGHWYLEPEFTYNNWNFLDMEDILLDEEAPTILERSDRLYGLNLGLPIGRHYKLRIFGNYIYNNDHYSNSETLTIKDTLDYLNISGIKAGMELSRNSLNKRIFPDDGLFYSLKTSQYSIEEAYKPGSTSEFTEEINSGHTWFKGEVHMEQYFKMRGYSIGYLFNGVISNQPSFSSPMGTIIYMPAFYPLMDSRALLLQKFRSPSYLAFGLRNIVKLSDRFSFRMEGYTFKELGSYLNTFTEGSTYKYEREPFHFVASGSLIYESPVGPLSLSFNYYDDEETRFGMLLNFGYLIFNRSSIE